MDLEQRIDAVLDRIADTDSELAAELKGIRDGLEAREEVENFAESFNETDTEGGDLAPASIALKRGRPSITLMRGKPALQALSSRTQMTFPDVESQVWRERLEKAAGVLARAASAVGRIELEQHLELSWAGTGFLVSDDIVVTNFHVAREFARRLGSRFIFRPNEGNKTIGASIDFLEEAGNRQDETFRIVEILHLQEDQNPDLALLRVEREELAVMGREAGTLPRYLELSTEPAREGQLVAAIGYPREDSHIRDQDLIAELFKGVFGKKRLAPGQITGVEDTVLRHDCSTLSGNSGSPLIDLETGKVVGVHFDGQFLETNFAVPAAAVAAALARVPPPAGDAQAGSAGGAGTARLDDHVMRRQRRRLERLHQGRNR
ncbi:MAG TPA: serine protease [Longimicrobium sp.]|nr:serine protease [Longimicrobium sp.]